MHRALLVRLLRLVHRTSCPSCSFSSCLAMLLPLPTLGPDQSVPAPPPTPPVSVRLDISFLTANPKRRRQWSNKTPVLYRDERSDPSELISPFSPSRAFFFFFPMVSLPPLPCVSLGRILRPCMPKGRLGLKGWGRGGGEWRGWLRPKTE